MKINEIKNMSDAELQAELANLKRRIFDLRSQSVTEKLENTSQITKTRKDIARISTVIRQRELSAQQTA
ncbi:MAG TPA: 50S ribosomal protein L29 [Phycisphaerae bacterium]|nr:50S ribosomal protein L29 [Phycisphaerae bacterium]HPS53140.1 50S ribosomal protein L29 [Phycisphaerae bacterium]